MKVILNDFGYMSDRRFLKATEGMTEFEWRTNEDVIALIEKKQNEINYLYELKEKGKATESQINKLRKMADWFHFRIKKVDTSRKWCFYEYDSSVGIKYLKEVDGSINYYGFI